VAELNEASKLMAETIESSDARGLRNLATEDLSAKNLLSHVNAIRLKVANIIITILMSIFYFDLFRLFK
jgi:hypothetical protein